MDVASAAVAFVGFAGQLLQGVSFIYGFLSDIQDAPEEIKGLLTRLRLLKGILDNMIIHSQAVCASNNRSSIVQEAMELVHRQVENLTNLIKENSPSGSGRRAMVLSNIKIAFRKDKFAKYNANLDRAKEMLQMAQMSVDSYILNQQTKALQDMRQALTTIQDSNIALIAAVNKPSKDIYESSSPIDDPSPFVVAAVSLPYEASTTSNKEISFTRFDGGCNPIEYHNRWIGTLKVTRKSTTTKTWSSQKQAYEVENNTQTTHVQLRPAPWLFQTGANIAFSATKALYGSLRIDNTIEPVRYTVIPQAAINSMYDGDLDSLKQMLGRGEISIYDRCHSTGANLIGLCLEHLLPHFWPEEWEEQETPKSAIACIVLWLISQGLTAEFQGNRLLCRNGKDEDEWLFVQTQSPSESSLLSIAAVVENRERLSVAITEELPPCLRAQRLLLFALLNPSHSLYLRSLIWDLLEDLSEDGVTSIEQKEYSYWAHKRSLFGFESVLLNGVIKMRKASRVTEVTLKTAMEEDARKGVRRFLSKLLAESAYQRDTRKSLVDNIANFLILSKEASILENGFGDHVANFACRLNRLDIWQDVLKKANLPAADYISQHLEANDNHQLAPPLQISLIKGPPLSIIAQDPHAPEPFESNRFQNAIKSYQQATTTTTTTKSSQQPIYDSHAPTEGSSDICFIRQEGTELFFDCGVTDPEFERHGNGHWDKEVEFWKKFDKDHVRYTHMDLEEVRGKKSADADVDVDEGEKTEAEVVSIDTATPLTASPGFLAQLVSGGVSVISGIV